MRASVALSLPLSLALAHCSASAGPSGPGDAALSFVDSSTHDGSSLRETGSRDVVIPLPDGAPPSEAASSLDASVAETGSPGDAGVDSGSADPTHPGAYAFKEVDGTITPGDGGAGIPVHVAYPTSGPSAGPYPVLLFAHGFTLSPTLYVSYLQYAASYGYVAITVNFAASITNVDNVVEAADLLSGLDWLKTQTAPPLAGLADLTHVASSGHSLGGKLAILAAKRDSRIVASIVFDPVDGSPSCNVAGDCPNARDAMPLPIPTGFLGETLDGTGAFGMACAPTATNYDSIYTAATTPSLEVTVLGAGHVSFVDSVAACGLFCSVCRTPTTPQAQVLALAHTYLAAFLERYVRGNMAYDTFLTGAEAQKLFVATSQVTILSK